jgi:hypothetical protein
MNSQETKIPGYHRSLSGSSNKLFVMPSHASEALKCSLRYPGISVSVHPICQR